MNEKEYWLAISDISYLSTHSILDLKEKFGNLRNAWEATDSDIKKVLGKGTVACDNFLKYRKIKQINFYKNIIRQARTNEIDILPYDDVNYPSSLKEIKNPPSVIYVKGKIETIDYEGIAVVGTRNPTHYGSQQARKIARELAENNVTVISGLARGIDTEAHKGALDGYGRTIAVLPCGLMHTYPEENEQLARDIISSGALISEVPINFKVSKWNLRNRNRVTTGLAKGTLVVEASKNSGALIAARYCKEQGKVLFTLEPKTKDRPPSYGPLYLIKEGAIPIKDSTSLTQMIKEGYEKIRMEEPIRAYSKWGHMPFKSFHITGPRILVKTTYDEERIIRYLLSSIASYLNDRNIKIDYLTDTKIHKIAYEATEQLNLPITRSWYMRGCYVHCNVLNTHTLQEYIFTKTVKSDTFYKKIKRIVEEVIENTQIIYERGDIYLTKLYSISAPERYKRIYIENHELLSLFGEIRNYLNSRTNKGLTLDRWVIIIPNFNEKLRNITNNLLSYMKEDTDFDLFYDEYKLFLELLDEVSDEVQRWYMKSRTNLPDEFLDFCNEMIDIYFDRVWKYPASMISINTMKGIRAAEEISKRRAYLDTKDDFFNNMFLKLKKRFKEVSAISS